MKDNIVIIEIANGKATVINSPKDIKHVVINWDSEDYESMLMGAGMCKNKARYYSDWVGDEEFEFYEAAGCVVEEFLLGTEREDELL